MARPRPIHSRSRKRSIAAWSSAARPRRQRRFGLWLDRGVTVGTRKSLHVLSARARSRDNPRMLRRLLDLQLYRPRNSDCRAGDAIGLQRRHHRPHLDDPPRNRPPRRAPRCWQHRHSAAGARAPASAGRRQHRGRQSCELSRRSGADRGLAATLHFCGPGRCGQLAAGRTHLRRMGVLFVDRTLTAQQRPADAPDDPPAAQRRAAGDLRRRHLQAASRTAALQERRVSMAARTQSPVVPIGIRGTREVFGGGRSVLRWAPITVEFVQRCAPSTSKAHLCCDSRPAQRCSR